MFVSLYTFGKKNLILRIIIMKLSSTTFTRSVLDGVTHDRLFDLGPEERVRFGDVGSYDT